MVNTWWEEEKARRAAARKALRASDFFSVGDILDSQWGWEQTQTDFYRVERVLEKSITIVPIAQRTTEYTGSMSEMVTAIPDHVIGEPRTVRVLTGGSVRVRGNYGFASKWHGRPMHQSHYA